ncbi:MAG: N-acetylmuramic acid 6-phosphate etherase [Acidobacteria bacterium]|nr:MAG: N-acetylmuramic acid 6-phosphate etherase [Acidobacteriota bacterium]
MRTGVLKTEQQNSVSADLDRLSALEIATLMNRQDASVLRAVRKTLPQIAMAIDLIRDHLAQGGRLIYVGAGTSGRIGAMDAAECPPTFGTDPSMIQFVIAGGESALARATESSEDSEELGISDMAARKPGRKDIVAALSASGRTPYTIAALKYAAKKGAATIAVTCNAESELASVAQIAIEASVGPEVLTGSTRLKAGTAEKLICNMLTTGALARLGYIYDNLMSNLPLTNKKLIERGISVIQQVAKVDRALALSTLETADMKVSVALVMLCARVSKSHAIRRLGRARGSVRLAIEGHQRPDASQRKA